MRRLSLLGVTALLAAAQERGPQFDVASVKAAMHQPPGAAGAPRSGGTGEATGGCPTSLKLDPAQVEIRCATLAMIIGYAWRFPPDRIQGPDWLQSVSAPRFDVIGKLTPGSTKAQVPEMVQSLLADRFRVQFHRANVAHAVYALTVARGGIRMKETAARASSGATSSDVEAGIGFFGATRDETAANPNGAGTITTISGPRMGVVRQFDTPDLMQRWESDSISLPGLADLLDKVAPLSLPIVDQTGLPGLYQLSLRISLNDVLAARREARASASRTPEDEDPSLRVYNDAFRKLGLQLQRRMAPIETIILDRAEKTPTDN
jgi:uncharacterized protein (TIGR03435 family)